MGQGKQQLKFERNPCNRFIDNATRQTKGRTPDVFRFHEPVKQVLVFAAPSVRNKYIERELIFIHS